MLLTRSPYRPAPGLTAHVRADVRRLVASVLGLALALLAASGAATPARAQAPVGQGFTVTHSAFDSNGTLNDPAGPDRQAAAVLDELALWSRSLNGMRSATG